MLTRATLLTRRFPPASALTHPHHPTQSILQLLVSPRRIPNTTRLGGRLPAPTRARILARWYSDGAAGAVGQQQQQQERDAGKEKEGEEGEGDGMRREIERRDKEIVELKDRYLRSVADYRNLQDRSKREMDATRTFAIQRFAQDLLESVDNLDLALGNVPPEKLAPPPSSSPSDQPSSSSASGASTSASAPTEPPPPDPLDPHRDLRDLHSGLSMTLSILLSTLRKHGLERFDPAETRERFDPNVHDAQFMTPVEGREDGSVFATVQKGFRLNGRVVRAAKVGVVRNT